MENIQVDALGLDCPTPLIKMKEALAGAKKGDTVEVLFTCPEAVENLPNYAAENDHEVVSFEKIKPTGWKIVIKK